MVVERGISEFQITQLVEFSRTDEQTRRFTGDTSRFKDLTEFYKWQEGKTIYTLSDRSDRLLGIIWFGRKNHPAAPNHPFTFAIRMYPPARGKGHSLEFMTKAFADFKSEGVWLSTHSDNLAAIKLYKKFGFREVFSEAKALIMVLDGPIV